MNSLVRTGCLATLAFILLSGVAGAAPSTINVIVNNTTVITNVDPYLKEGTTMVPLNIVQKLPDISVSWDNSTKTVTIFRKGTSIQLVVGQKTATIGLKKITLPVMSTLEKGRVMVPLRFIAESADAYVAWNPYTRIVYVAKASEQLTAQFTGASLAEARTAAFQLPRVDQLKAFEIDYREDQTQYYYFPEGASTQFFLRGSDLIYYYEVKNGVSQVVWTAKLDLANKSSDGLAFLPYKILQQDGKMPTVTTRIVFYELMLPIMEASYGFIDTLGHSTTLGQQGMELNQFFEIAEERK